MIAVFPTVESLSDWHVGLAADGTPEVVVRLTDRAEARAWAVWLLERNEDAADVG
jgi:hypothetical protein